MNRNTDDGDDGDDDDDDDDDDNEQKYSSSKCLFAEKYGCARALVSGSQNQTVVRTSYRPHACFCFCGFHDFRFVVADDDVVVLSCPSRSRFFFHY